MKKCTNVIWVYCSELEDCCTSVTQAHMIGQRPDDQEELLRKLNGWKKVQWEVDMPYGMQSQRLGRVSTFGLS